MFAHLSLFMAALAITAASAGEDLTVTTWEAALALAQRHDKPILIDFFTKW